MRLLPSVFPVSEYRGSPRQCGRAYGDEHAESLGTYLDAYIKWKPRQWRFTKACSKTTWRHQKYISEFVQGAAEGSGRSFLELYSLLCEEELGRMGCCTALGATGKGTRDGQPVIGMNWDGIARLYPFASLLRLRTGSAPATLTYVSVPGQWPCAGMNEHGLSLVWTSASHSLRRRFKWPRVGVPTYALIAGVLACKNCGEALELLRTTPNAGGFIFFIADAAGEVCVVEGIPGRTATEPCCEVIGRSNHLEIPALCELSRQRVPHSVPTSNSKARSVRMWEMLKRYTGRIDRAAVEAMLRDERAPGGLTICQCRAKGNLFMTVDSFYCLPKKREFWIARGLQTRHAYARHKL